MGYASYILPDGREAGYAIEATCDEPGCDTRIDRGLAYLCGHEPADGLGCGDYFCGEHLYLGAPWPGGQWCRACVDTERCVACGSTDVAGHGESTLHDLRYAVCPLHLDEGYEHAMAEHQPCDCVTERGPDMDTEQLGGATMADRSEGEMFHRVRHALREFRLRRRLESGRIGELGGYPCPRCNRWRSMEVAPWARHK